MSDEMNETTSETIDCVTCGEATWSESIYRGEVGKARCYGCHSASFDTRVVISTLRAARDDFKAEARHHADRSTELAGERDKLHIQLTDVETRLDEYRAEVMRLANNWVAVTAERDELAETLNKLRIDAAEAANAHTFLQADHDRLKLVEQDLRRKVRELKGKLPEGEAEAWVPEDHNCVL